ncbi:MAG: sodium-dependent transporter [Cytophagales bacterium]|nr:sodium-dependent transporter [Cytophagales bacterium]
MSEKSRDGFSSRLGIVAAAAGSAIGLGNIWKFPYVAGMNGGAAFILIYLLFIILVGMPTMLSAFIIGRSSQKNVVGAFKRLSPRTPWFLFGIISVFGAFLLLSFYSVVAGWTVEYTFLALKNSFSGLSTEALQQLFADFVSSPWRSILWQGIFISLTCWIVYFGIKEGIEKYSKVLMPVLFVFILVLVFRGVTLKGAEKGISFLLEPNFDLLNKKMMLSALGQAFFSLSLGLGTMVIYGSYIKKDVNLQQTTLQISIADTLIALLSGLAIFPAVFAFGINPSEGANLIFIALPTVFQQIFGGYVFGLLFFILLAIAALTSAISILEVLVSYLVEEHRVERKRATIILSLATFLVGIPCALSSSVFADITIMDKNLFDVLDFIVTHLIMPIGSMAILIYTGWFLDKKILEEEFTAYGRYSKKFFILYLFLAKIFAPAAVFIVFIHGLGMI